MELVKLTEEEFNSFASNHEQATFLQTINWGKLKEANGWKWELLGFKDKDKVIAGMMLLSKTTPIKKKMFYAPRGFILDYNNTALLEEFTLKTKKYVKDNGGIFIKIDPYVESVERDIDGNIVEGGYNNKEIIKELKKLGFKEQFAKPGQVSLQPKWLYKIDVKDKTLDEVMKEMSSKTRQMIRKNEKNGVVVREGKYEDLEEFQKIMEHTSERRHFLDRSLSYYQNMYKAFGNGEILRLYFADLMIEDKLNDFKKELVELENSYKELVRNNENGKRVKEQTLKDKETQIEKTKESITKYKELYEKYGSKLTLGGVLFFIYGKEVLAFLGGAYKDYMEFQCSYSIYYELIKYAVDNKFDYYNFYGISSDLSPKDPMYGVYLFKKGFGGKVVELLGEYDLKVSGFYYFIYKVSYFIVHKLKKIKTKI